MIYSKNHSPWPRPNFYDLKIKEFKGQHYAYAVVTSKYYSSLICDFVSFPKLEDALGFYHAFLGDDKPMLD